MTISQAGIIQQIENSLEFLIPYLSLANCHMVDFFTKSAYIKYIPSEIRNEINTIGINKVPDLIFNKTLHQLPNLQQYVENCNKLTLMNTDICVNVDTFAEQLKTWGCSEIDKLKLSIFMTPKKSHEVEIMSAIAASVSKLSKNTHLVDIGDGKGYLSSMLALHHQVPVLGVDASNVNTCGALKRVTKLSKVWNSVATAPNKSFPTKNNQSQNNNVQLYKQVTSFIDDRFDLHKLVSEMYSPSASLRLGLVGLHTCGNLMANSLRIYTKQEYVSSICNVGCCYHLLEEKFENYSETSEVGFPISGFLTKKRVIIGRSARMIANQSVDRILDTKELPNKSIYFRALLQVLLEEYCEELPTKHVGRCKKECFNFVEYARKAMKRIDLNLEITDSEIENLSLQFSDRTDELNVFYLIRSRLAPVIESLILLDKLLYLYEQGYDKSFLVQLFDPVISPRCYGIISIK